MLDNQGYLKLKANDKNDLKVFAAYLQDSITVPQDIKYCLLYTSPSPRDRYGSRMPSSA